MKLETLWLHGGHVPDPTAGTYTQFNDILPALDVKVKFVDSNDPENFRKAIDAKKRALFCETVSNPALEVECLEAIAIAAGTY